MAQFSGIIPLHIKVNPIMYNAKKQSQRKREREQEKKWLNINKNARVSFQRVHSFEDT